MQQNPLGKTVAWPTTYDPTLLYRIERRRGDSSCLGHDRWCCYELYWLTESGTPAVGIGEIVVPANSPYIVESKSLKLYLGSFFQSTFPSREVVEKTVESDLRSLLECEEIVFTIREISAPFHMPSEVKGESLDNLLVDSSPELRLIEGGAQVERFHFTNLFRSLCPVTGQPDYATVLIKYRGHEIDTTSLLSYLVGYRITQDFHEHCCEKIYSDLMRECEPEELLVECLYTRRGGIDINPLRYSPSFSGDVTSIRTMRQ